MCDNRQNLGLKLQSVVDTTCLEAVHCSYSFTVTDVVDTKSHNPYFFCIVEMQFTYYNLSILLIMNKKMEFQIKIENIDIEILALHFRGCYKLAKKVCHH